MLAGLPNRPYSLDPYKAPNAALTQRNIVLSQMRDAGHITEQQYAAATAEPLTLASPHQPKA